MEVKPGYKQTEVGVIPEDWRVGPLGGLVSSVIDNRGKTPPLASHGHPMIEVNAIYGADRTPNFSKVTKFVDQHTYENWFRRGHPKTGDILIATVGTAGASVIVGDQPGVIAQNIIALRVSSQHNPSFVFQYTQTELFKSQVRSVLMGAVQPSLKVPHLLGFLISYPRSEPEQCAIATALSDVDALLGALDRLIAKKRDLKQAALQQLLTGQTRLPGFHGEWEVKRLGDVVDTDPENLGSDTKSDFAFNYIALEDVDRGFLRSHSEQLFSNAPSRARRKLHLDDVLVSTVRPNLQSHLLFRAEGGSWVCSTGFCVVRCRQGVTHPSYVFFHLFANCVNRQIETLLTGSNYPAINSGDVRALEIPLPTHAEQIAIAAVLTEMDAELAVLEQRLAKTRALKQGMMQELLTGRTRLI